MQTGTLGNITALILAYNEEANIGRTLSKLRALRRVVVIDSGSTDGTREIVAKYENTEVIARPFDSFADQCNFGLAQASIDTEWVLSLDADYVLSDDLIAEMTRLTFPDDVSGYRARFRYCVYGKVIRCGVYPPVTVLFRRNGAKFVNDGHGHRVVLSGNVENLSSCVYHDDRKPLSRWLDSQKSYALREAEHLVHTNRATLRWQDRLRVMIGVAPPLMFLYVFFVRGGILDGWHGLYYALQRAYAELLLSIELLDRRLQRVLRQ
jgi:glycosyltransferase involved in cell wall biosynthesis